jgi:hypothetical protein
MIISHNPSTKVSDGAEIWPQQAHNVMPSKNLLICRVVCPTFAMQKIWWGWDMAIK